MRKKILATLMAALMVVSLIPAFAFPALAATNKVTFVMADTGKTEVVKEIVDGKVDAPEAPAIENYAFAGWYYYDKSTDESTETKQVGMKKFDQTSVEDKSITVYAVYLLNCKYNGESGDIDFIKTNFYTEYNYAYSYQDGKDMTFSTTKQMPNEPGTYGVWIRGRALSVLTNPEIAMEIGDAVIYTGNTIVIKNAEHGSAYAQVDGKKVTYADKDAVVTLVATPDDGYEFEKWEVVSGTVTIKDDKFTMPETDVTIKPVFKEIKKEDIPQTADSNNMLIWIVIALAAISLTTCTVLRGKRTNK